MTHLTKAIVVFLLLSMQCKAQIISSLEEGVKKDSVISYIIEPEEDWNSIYDDFNKTTSDTVSDNNLKKLTETTDDDVFEVKILCFNGDTLKLPCIRDIDGTDLFMLTPEGISLYMAALAPVYYQETTADLMKWIRYFAFDKKTRTITMFHRYEKWEKHIKATFEEYGIPLEIAELCMVESGCTYRAISKAGAVGMWQIMPQTGIEWGMHISCDRDDRTDPIISTETAARILASSFKKTKDWTLCIAGYNCGMGRVETLIRKNGTYNWLKLKEKFPEETRQYIPSLLAIHYCWEYRKELALTTD